MVALPTCTCSDIALSLADVAEGAEGDALQRHFEERSIGCKIVDLQYVVPNNGLALGGVFFKSKEGTVLCDISADSVLATVSLLSSLSLLRVAHIVYIAEMVRATTQEDFVKQGMRPGLLLKEIKTADGFVRSMRRNDFSYLQAMKQLTVAKRPFFCTFEPRAVPMEFTLDDSSAEKTTPPPNSDVDSQYARYGISSACLCIIRLRETHICCFVRGLSYIWRCAGIAVV